jgi:formate--tetrahydrofolate ligase
MNEVKAAPSGAPDSDLHIARRATLKPIAAIGARLGIPEDALEPYGRVKAKLDFNFIAGLAGRKTGKLVLVTAISPTPAGEGKTTTTIGLGDALNRLGQKAAICLREPSLGPCFGAKGGATGGGYAQIGPMTDINLHFTGDIHAVSAAHNLLAALVDNHVYWRGAPALDPRRITWPRVLDMNDRSLRNMVVGLGGAANGTPRESRFDIATASEVMAILCLSRDLADLQRRLGDIVVGETFEKRVVRAAELRAAGAMAALLRDALKPNLVQTLENNPAFVHGGPFANIAHGCNSVLATTTALRLSDIVVTEAGFGADLGAEKFIDIKCRQAGLAPDLAVVVATVRALKYHGGVEVKDLRAENVGAVERGLPNLIRHVENLKKFGMPVLVAINAFITDSPAEMAAIEKSCAAVGVKAVPAEHWARGGAGAEALGLAALEILSRGDGKAKPLYADELPLLEKIGTVAREIYRAKGLECAPGVAAKLQAFEAAGFGKLPVCIAKTQYSFSSDAKKRGAPEGHILPVREVRLAAGAGFVVAVCGDIQTMPGLPREPAAFGIHLDGHGEIEGLS